MTAMYEAVASNVEEMERLLIRLRRITDPLIETYFYDKILKARRKPRKFSRSPIRNPANVFRKVGVLTPDRVRIRAGDLAIQASIATSPAITGSIRNTRLYLRVSAFPSSYSESFIAKADMSLAEGAYELVVEPILPRLLPREGVGDPRVDPIDPNVIYHVREYRYWDKPGVYAFRAVLTAKGGIRISPVILMFQGDFRAYSGLLDTFPLNSKHMVMAPDLGSKNTSAVIIGPRDDVIVDTKDLTINPELTPDKWETRVGAGFATRLSRSENLLFYYNIDPYGVHRIYAAILDETGSIIAGTKEPVIAPGNTLLFTRSPSVIKPFGAIIEKNKIILSVGVGEEALAFYEAKLDDLLRIMVYRR